VVKVKKDVRVGRVVIPFATARQWVSEYTDQANTLANDPYAYPAYDCYDGERNDPEVLTDADLLAPVLLNVNVRIRSYYALQRVRPILEGALKNGDLASPLAEIQSEKVVAAVKPLYSVLDDPAEKPWGVSGTTLSKIFHRKRPESVVLHDRWVRSCYVGHGGPVPFAGSRSWSDYMAAVTMAIRDDIRSQRPAFEALDEATTCHGKLSHVRLLDVLAWRSQGKAPS
jgi:hypothetical protein